MRDEKLIIVKDYATDSLKIYWRTWTGKNEVDLSFDGENLVETIRQAPSIIKPFISMPLHMGEKFIELFMADIEKQGLNTRKIDMQAGKIEVLQTELDFNKQQIVKLIDHLTKQP